MVTERAFFKLKNLHGNVYRIDPSSLMPSSPFCSLVLCGLTRTRVTKLFPPFCRHSPVFQCAFACSDTFAQVHVCISRHACIHTHTDSVTVHLLPSPYLKYGKLYAPVHWWWFYSHWLFIMASENKQFICLSLSNFPPPRLSVLCTFPLCLSLPPSTFPTSPNVYFLYSPPLPPPLLPVASLSPPPIPRPYLPSCQSLSPPLPAILQALFFMPCSQIIFLKRKRNTNLVELYIWSINIEDNEFLAIQSSWCCFFLERGRLKKTTLV